MVRKNKLQKQPASGNDQANQGKKRRGLRKIVRSELVSSGNGKPGQKLHGSEKPLHEVLHCLDPLTPAAEKVAISFRSFALASSSGIARAAPVPSPSRRSRLSRGSRSMNFSKASCPGSVERCEAKRKYLTRGSIATAIAAAAVEIN